MLSVQLFGTPQIRLHGQPLDTLRRKNRAVMYFIAAHPKAISRDQVLARFWPDDQRGAAQQSFRTMLHEMRKALGDALVIDRESLSLANTVVVDARAFEPAITTPTTGIEPLERALALYAGDFLDGFTLADTPSFDDWTASERERYRLLAVRGFASLARLREANHDGVAALDAVESALKLDSLQEDLHRTAMRLRYHTGDRVGAIRQFESLRRLLDDELGVAPMPETRALYDRIITDRLTQTSHAAQPPTSSRARASAPLEVQQPATAERGDAAILTYIGRAREHELLRRAESEGKLALIEGEPGIGKTRLAEEFAGGQAALVLRGTAHELEQSLPYQPVIEALRSLTARVDWPALCGALQLAPMWLNEAARLVPELAAEPEAIATSPPNGSKVWESILRLLQSLAQRQRVILFLDDLQWADSTTLGLIGYLARRTTSPSLLLLCTTRLVEPNSKLAGLLQSLAREGKLARIQPGPLSPKEVSTLVGEFNGSSSEWFAEWLADKSEGNPFFATELLRFAKANGWLDDDAPRPPALTMAAAATVPETIRDLIASRMNHLSEPTRRTLDIAAVIGREFNFDLIVQVSQSDEISVLDAFDELRAAALVQPGRDDDFRFDHSLTLDVTLREMGTTRNRALHRRVAEALDAPSTTPRHPLEGVLRVAQGRLRAHDAELTPVAGSIAQHYFAGNAPDRAAPYALRAGQFAASIAAWAEAIAFFEQALNAGPVDLRIAALTSLGESHFHNGDLRQATRALQSALDATQASGADFATDFAAIEAIYESLTQALLPQGRYAEVIANGEALLRNGPPELALYAEFVMGTGLDVESAHPAEAERHLREAERLLNQSRTFNSRVTLAKLRFHLANVLGQQGKTQQAIAMYWGVLNLVRQDESTLDLQRHILLYNQLAYYLHLVGDPTAAEYAQAGLKFAREKGSLTHQSYLLSTSGEIALAQGDLDAAERFFSEGLAVAEHLSTPERIAGHTANLGLIARQRGQTAVARERLTRALALADELGAQHLSARIRAWLIPLLPADEARAMLHETRILAEQSGYGKLLDELAVLAQGLG